MDEQKIFTMLGEMKATMKAVEKHTEQIPLLTQRISSLEVKVKFIEPKVEKHQKIVWIGTGAMGVFSFIWTAILAWIEGGAHKS